MGNHTVTMDVPKSFVEALFCLKHWNSLLMGKKKKKKLQEKENLNKTNFVSFFVINLG